jgi:hypothetical protein
MIFFLNDFFLDEGKCFGVCCIVVKSAEKLENCEYSTVHTVHILSTE